MADATPEEQGAEQPKTPETPAPAVPPVRRSAPARAAIAGGKVFVQGLIFTEFLLALAYVMAFGLLPLFAGQTIAGGNLTLFVLGLLGIDAVFTVATGYVNSQLMRLFWFPIHFGWGASILQGIVLVLTLSLVGILPFSLALNGLPGLFSHTNNNVLYFVVGNVILALFYGAVARSVGGHWRKTMPGSAGAPVITPEPVIEPSNPAGLHCPRCGGANLVVAEDHSAYCIDCRRGLSRESMGAASA